MSHAGKARFRRATFEDIPAIVRVVNRAYRVEEFFVFGDRTDDADIRARMADHNACFLVIDDPGASAAGGQLAGAVYVEVRGERGYFAMLSVDPDRQKQGHGRTLVLAAEAHCRDAGCRWLDIDVVNVRSELPAFYAPFGFAPVSTAPFPDPEKLKHPAQMVLMTKELVSAGERLND